MVRLPLLPQLTRPHIIPKAPLTPGGPAWRLREQAKSANSWVGSGPAASLGHEEQPKMTENKDDGSQPPKSVWKPSRMQEQQ